MSQRKKITDTKVPASSGDRVKIVEDFLTEHYEIKINVFDSSKTIIVAKNPELYDQAPNETLISLHMERENIRGCDTILRKILKSGYHITSFNPISDYIQSLEGAWKGKSHIDLFCKDIVARDFGDKEPGYYQERFVRILKKWMVASIACSLGIKENDAVIGFIHSKEGIGKTRIIKFLIPKPLKAYYIQSSKEDRYFDITSAFTQNFMINFDEFNGITKSNAEQVKQVLTQTEYVLSKRDTNAVARIGNGAFTSNKNKEMGGFLHPSMGTRRWATIELDSIDWKKYTGEVDNHQMWAEAMVLFKNADFDYVWNEDDFKEFKEYNNRYLIETNANKLVKEYYRIPEEGEESTHMQPLEILQELRRSRKLNNSNGVNVSDVTLGMALSSMGFEHKMKKVDGKPRYGYQVIQLFE
jgi:predicted P-loop ATPase